MLGSNLLQILESFSNEDMIRFRLFINSPFFNKNEIVVKFFDCIKKFHPSFQSSKLSKENIFRKLFKGEIYNDGMMRTIIFKTNSLAEKYICNKAGSENSMENNFALLEYFNKNRMEKLFQKKFEEINSEVEKMPFKDENYYLRKIKLFFHYEVFVENNRYKFKGYEEQRYKSSGDVNKNLTYYFFLMTLSHYTFFFEDTSEGKPDMNNKILNILIEFLIANIEEFSDNKIIKLQALEFLLYKEKDEKYYYSLKDLLINSPGNFRYTDRYNLHNVLQHYCQGKIFHGHSNFKRERFELYNTALDQNLVSLYEGDYFNDLLFGSITQNCVSLSEFKWADGFISKYSSRLSPDIRDVVVNFLQAYICASQKNFESSLVFLNKIGPITNISYKAPVRDLTIKSLFELGLFSELSYHIDAYKKYINQNRRSYTDYRYLRIKNYINYLGKLFRFKEKSDISSIKDLRIEIEANTNTMERLWLLEKIDEILK